MPLTATAIDAALDAVLTAILVHKAQRRADASAELPVALPIHWQRDASQIPTRDESEVTALVADPVGAALRQAVRQLGQQLHDGGGTDAMRLAIDRVADREPAHAGHRASIMDHAWNAVGTDKDRWWS